MSASGYHKLPRLYISPDLKEGATVPLDKEQAHYLGTVLRRKAGDSLRLFNGRDGEWLAVLTKAGKKEAEAQAATRLRPQSEAGRETHLLFAPIKKNRLEWLIEKAAELGATHLHPVLTQNTEVRDVREDRLRRQLAEAAEQCERLDMPVLEPLTDLAHKLEAWPASVPLYACLERFDGAPALRPDEMKEKSAAFLIGPEGGFTGEEKNFIVSFPFVRPVTLGENVLRAETAAIVCLAARLDPGR